MTIGQILGVLNSGGEVCWKNDGYKVVKIGEQWHVVRTSDGEIIDTLTGILNDPFFSDDLFYVKY